MAVPIPGIARKIYTAARSLGATDSDLDMLIGLAAAESNFDLTAVGDQDLPTGPRYGLWQIETESGIGLTDQVEAAWRRLQTHNRELRPVTAQDPPFDHLIDNSWTTKCRLRRAAWQRRPDSLTKWIAHILKIWNGAMLSAQVVPGVPVDGRERYAQAMLMGKNMFDQADRDEAWHMRFKIKSFIKWSGTDGADTEALDRGQETFSRYMEKYNWHPAEPMKAEWEKGEGAGMGDVWDVEETRPPWVPGGGGLSETMSWVWKEIQGGLMSFGKGALKTLLPIAGILVVGGLTYSAIKKFIQDTPTKEES